MGRIRQQLKVDTVGYWDNNVSMWLYRKVKTDFTYDSKGIEIESESSAWDATYGWSDPGYYVTFTFDANSNPVEKLIYRWNSDLIQYTVYQKIVYSYDSNGYQTEYIMYSI